MSQKENLLSLMNEKVKNMHIYCDYSNQGFTQFFK